MALAHTLPGVAPVVARRNRSGGRRIWCILTVPSWSRKLLDEPGGPSRLKAVYGVRLSIVRKLQEHGFVAYFAGGCIRDALLGISTKGHRYRHQCEPRPGARAFSQDHSGRIQFGVVRVRAADMEFEVATFRSDGVYLDGRHPSGDSVFDALNKMPSGGISRSMECFTIP